MIETNALLDMNNRRTNADCYLEIDVTIVDTIVLDVRFQIVEIL
jgi:hypothetical protein